MAKIPLLVFCLTVISVLKLFVEAEDDSYIHNQEIRKKLLKGYDKNALPQRDANDTITVKLGLYPRSFLFNDDLQIFTLHSWVGMKWKDKRLVWDYKDFGGLDMVHFGDGELWKPDIHVYNNADITEVDHYGNVHFLVYSSGHVIWIPPATMHTPCPLDLKFWPFDEHVCPIIMGSWTTGGWQINLDLMINTTKINTWTYLESSTIWKMESAMQRKTVEKYDFESEPYISLEYEFRMKRNSPTFASFAVVPAVLIPALLLVQFILPVDHKQRLSLGYLCALLVFLELLFLKVSLPKLGTSVPLIVSYYSQCFIMVVLTVILSAVLGRLVHPQNPLLSFPPPELLKRLLTGPLAVILCLKNHAGKVGLCGKTAEDGEVLDPEKSTNFSHEWLFVAKVIDRCALILFVCTFSISLIGYLSHLN